jgi:hypothetical protein
MADLQEIQVKLEDVKGTMTENIQFALRNTEKVEDIQAKSELLVTSSNTFKDRATVLKARYCNDCVKCNLVIWAAMGIIALIVAIAK